MITVSIFHDTRRQKQNGKYPVKICVNIRHTAKYYGTGIDLTKLEFIDVLSKRTPSGLLSTKAELTAQKEKAEIIVKSLKPHFTFSRFIKKFASDTLPGEKVTTVYDDYIKRLNKDKRIGTASTYTSSKKSISSFFADLTFEDITVEFLKDYEQWMLEKGKSLTTIGIYLRNLRAIYNEAIALEIIPKELYPFGRRKYELPNGCNIKKALHISDIGKIYNYEPETHHEGEAKGKDFWLFSYFGNGINMKDMSLLKFKNIDGEYIEFIREKTKRSRRNNPKPIRIYVTEEMRHIIDKWCNKEQDPENFIFPILKANMTPVQQRDAVQLIVRVVNTWIRRIGQKVGIEKDITTYTARHSFSTVLKRSGASISYISEALGHTDVKTTESYLDSFEDDTKKQFASALVGFKTPNFRVASNE